MNNPWVKRLGYFIATLLILHLVVEVTGHHYLYQTLEMTVFKGKLGPDIEEYQELPGRTISSEPGTPWTRRDERTVQLTAEEEAFHTSLESVNFLVIQQDEILFEKYWQSFDDASISNSFSMAKSMVSLLTGIAIDKGFIKSLDDPVYWYLPEYEMGMGSQLKVWHLLTMSSGLNFDEHYLNPFAFPARANYGDDLEALLRNYKVTEEPGKVFKYQSGSTQVLAMVLQAATKTNLAQLLQEWVWKPIGAQRDAIWSLDHEDGIEKAFCCVNATARDFSRIGKLYLQHGRWEGVQLVDSTYVAKSISPAPLLDKDGEPCATYGYTWWLGDYKGYDFFFMRGIKGQYVMVIPELELIITRLGRKRLVGTPSPHPEDVYRYLDMGLRIAGV